MRFLGTALVLIGAVTAAGAAIVVMMPPEPQPAPAETVTPAPAPETRKGPGHWQDPSTGGAADTVRRIAPDAVAVPAVRQAALQRIEPRKPLTPPPETRPDDLDPSGWKPRLLFNPVATAAGRIEVEGFKLVVSGIEPVPVDRMCKADGETVPCGRIARTAFRNWLRGRAVRCAVPDKAPDMELTAKCTVSDVDPALWLVEHGWARPAAGQDSQLAEAGVKARAGKAGLYAWTPVSGTGELN